ncbi:helix-hairpin-helix domain-containing protein [Idiomarina seosinensis]|uniref:ComEA family DNA-binding protein n=1 Tax=Idiomarina seosinensis TaxID=281739 RepID=UPI003850A21D
MLRKTMTVLATSLVLSSIITAPVMASFVSAPVTQQAAAAQEASQKLNINTASVQELAAAMVGIGLKRAEQIIQLREQLGGFTELEQLLDVKGIGLRTLEKNQPLISLD